MQQPSNLARLHAQSLRVLARSAQLRHRRRNLPVASFAASAGPPRAAPAQLPLSLQRALAAGIARHPAVAVALRRWLASQPAEKPPAAAEGEAPPASSGKSAGAASPSAAAGSTAASDSTAKAKSSGSGGGGSGSGKGGGGSASGDKKPAPPSSSPDDDNNASWMGQAALALFIMLGLSLLGNRDNGREISFQEFVWDLLEPGYVDRVEVVNRNVARVYLKSSARIRAQDALSSSGSSAPRMGAGRARWSRAAGGADSDMPDWGMESDADMDMGGAMSSDRAGLGASASSSPGFSGMAGGAAAPGEAPFYFNIGAIDMFERKLEAAQEDLGIEPDDFVPVIYSKESSITSELLRQLPSILLLGVGILVLRNAASQLGGMGGGRTGGIFQVGKANPTVVKAGESGGQNTTFAHVAGLDEAKQEVMEFVDFLKNPGHYEKLGAKIPKGALLVGPPGTGKTLLAKATAGEANVPFFSMSGSDFIEMFVGVGPSRVRDLFGQARSSAPCIIFIDEIDAIGKARGRGGMAGGNDERENTLNALLVEMDGFTSSSGVVVLAGTNRADVLDRALLRPGRFDRQINIDKPDMRGRFQIFMVHLQPLKLEVDATTIAKRLAALTPGFAGADIANICNEAALIAARGDKDFVQMIDFEKATDRVIGGLEKKNKVISRKEREIVAHHEAGHAVAGWFLKHADPLIKVSIIPRGSAALGFAQYLPVDKFLQSKEQLRDFMIMALGGRVAEQLCFGSITTGAQDDLKRVTRAVYAQITNFGMSEKVGKVYFPRAGESGNQFYKPYSEQTAEMIDEEAVRMVEEAYADCENLLTDKLDVVKALAAQLLEKEVLGEEELKEIMGDRPYAKPATYDEFVGRYEKDRAKRTRSGGDSDGKAKDGSMTPPIPVSGADESSTPNSFKPGGGAVGGAGGETIPELA